MWAATVAPGYKPQTTYHDTEAEATAWCEREMRAAGTKHGICWELDLEGDHQ